MKNLIKNSLFAVITTLYSTSAMAWVKDTPLNKNAQTILHHIEQYRQNATPEQIQTSYFLLGVGYMGNPEQIGKDIATYYMTLNQYPDGINDEQKNQDLKAFTQQYKVIEKPNKRSFLSCTWRNNPKCVNNLFQYESQWNDVQKQYHILSQRYLELLNRPPAVAMENRDFMFPMPAYQNLIYGQKLELLRLFTQASLGHKDVVRQQSLKQLEQLRYHSSKANHLVEKLIFDVMIIQQLQAIVLLKTRYHVDFNHHLIPDFTPAEHDFSWVLAQEFIFLKLTMEDLLTTIMRKSMNEELISVDELPAEFASFAVLFESLDKISEYQKKTLYHLTYKVNDTINYTADYILKHMQASRLNSKKFNELYHSNFFNKNIKINPLYNAIGYYLFDIGMPDYKVYLARSYSIENYINITNYILSDKKTPLKNIFKTKTQLKKSSICMDFIDKIHYRHYKQCLYLIK